jgi:hypothetical protein
MVDPLLFDLPNLFLDWRTPFKNLEDERLGPVLIPGTLQVSVRVAPCSKILPMTGLPDRKRLVRAADVALAVHHVDPGVRTRFVPSLRHGITPCRDP